MTIAAEFSLLFHGQFGVLILDNEVTVGHFVTTPPLVWSRLTQRDGVYRVADGYPSTLTTEQTRREMRTWDPVSGQGIVQTLRGLEASIDYVVVGNNAGQGLPLARSVPQHLRGPKSAIIFAEGLPEIRQYEDAGFQTFLRRRELISHLARLARSAGRPLGLAFINTIQHDASNYHDP